LLLLKIIVPFFLFIASNLLYSIIDENFEEAEKNVSGLLDEQGFGVPAEIDVQQTLHEKPNVDFHKYKIPGACNPLITYQALIAGDKIGVMLPCNIIMQERETGVVEVSTINPLESMAAVKNEQLTGIAEEVTARLNKTIDQDNSN